MTPAELLAELHEAGATVAVESGRLKINAPPGVVGFALAGRVKQMRDDLIDLLCWDAERARVLRLATIASLWKLAPNDFAFPEDFTGWQAREDAIDAAVAERNLPAMRAALAEYERFAQDEFGRWRDAQAAPDVDVLNDFESLPIPRYH